MFTESARSASRSVSDEHSPPGDLESPPSQLRIVNCDTADPRREEAERFVQERFLRTHGARIQTFMPIFLLLTDAEGALRGVAGCRLATSEPLFLERYLTTPIESALAAATGAKVRRTAIAEVGNFACRDSHAATVFVSLLPHPLVDLGLTWVAFTATDSIRRILRHLGARCADLGPADCVYARNGPDEWGRYYARDPRVLAGYLPLARRIPGLWSVSHGD